MSESPNESIVERLAEMEPREAVRKLNSLPIEQQRALQKRIFEKDFSLWARLAAEGMAENLAHNIPE